MTEYSVIKIKQSTCEHELQNFILSVLTGKLSKPFRQRRRKYIDIREQPHACLRKKKGGAVNIWRRRCYQAISSRRPGCPALGGPHHAVLALGAPTRGTGTSPWRSPRRVTTCLISAPRNAPHGSELWSQRRSAPRRASACRVHRRRRVLRRWCRPPSCTTFVCRARRQCRLPTSCRTFSCRVRRQGRLLLTSCITFCRRRRLRSRKCRRGWPIARSSARASFRMLGAVAMVDVLLKGQ